MQAAWRGHSSSKKRKREHITLGGKSVRGEDRAAGVSLIRHTDACVKFLISKFSCSKDRRKMALDLTLDYRVGTLLVSRRSTWHSSDQPWLCAVHVRASGLQIHPAGKKKGDPSTDKWQIIVQNWVCIVFSADTSAAVLCYSWALLPPRQLGAIQEIAQAWSFWLLCAFLTFAVVPWKCRLWGGRETSAMEFPRARVPFSGEPMSVLPNPIYSTYLVMSFVSVLSFCSKYHMIEIL